MYKNIKIKTFFCVSLLCGVLQKIQSSLQDNNLRLCDQKFVVLTSQPYEKLLLEDQSIYKMCYLSGEEGIPKEIRYGWSHDFAKLIYDMDKNFSNSQKAAFAIWRSYVDDEFSNGLREEFNKFKEADWKDKGKINKIFNKFLQKLMKDDLNNIALFKEIMRKYNAVLQQYGCSENDVLQAYDVKLTDNEIRDAIWTYWSLRVSKIEYAIQQRIQQR